MNILAFESSCDETAVAVVRDGRTLLSDAILSQADMHALYGGVVPEIASRKHVQAIAALTDKALADAGLLVVADEGYITNVAVDPACRRQGVANQLLQVFDSFARGNHLAFLTLEVRPSNAAAIALYQGFGFTEAGRRRNYYDLPKEDALILTKYYTEEAAQ